MKKLFIAILFGTLLVGGGKNSLAQSTIHKSPFLYMENNKFYYQEEEHFLKTCNYLANLYINADNEFIISINV